MELGDTVRAPLTGRPMIMVLIDPLWPHAIVVFSNMLDPHAQHESQLPRDGKRSAEVRAQPQGSKKRR